MSRSNRMFEANAVRKTSKYSAVSVKPRFARISCNPWVACGMFLVDAYVNEIKGRSTSCKGDELSPSARMIGRIALCSAKPQAFSSHIPKTCLPLSFPDLALTWQLDAASVLYHCGTASVIVDTNQPFVFLPPETEARFFLYLMCFSPRSKGWATLGYSFSFFIIA